MAEKFNLIIETRRGTGYCLGADAPSPNSAALRLAEALTLNYFLQSPETLRPYVQSETQRSQGLEHLRPLLQAAQAQRVVGFDIVSTEQTPPAGAR